MTRKFDFNEDVIEQLKAWYEDPKLHSVYEIAKLFKQKYQKGVSARWLQTVFNRMIEAGELKARTPEQKHQCRVRAMQLMHSQEKTGRFAHLEDW